jgi:hypothetical protein
MAELDRHGRRGDAIEKHSPKGTEILAGLGARRNSGLDRISIAVRQSVWAMIFDPGPGRSSVSVWHIPFTSAIFSARDDPLTFCPVAVLASLFMLSHRCTTLRRRGCSTGSQIYRKAPGGT